MGVPWDLGVYVILDSGVVRDLAQMMRDCAQGGVEVFQLRDKAGLVSEEDGRMFSSLARELGVGLIVNDDPDFALRIGASGVHLGPNDMSPEEARRIAPDMVIGGSAGTPERAKLLVEQGVDYLGCGAVFEARVSKSDASAPQGTGLILEVCNAVDVPVVGIGGITLSNAAEVILAGAHGVALIRAVANSDRPEDAARALVSEVRRARLELNKKV